MRLWAHRSHAFPATPTHLTPERAAQAWQGLSMTCQHNLQPRRIPNGCLPVSGRREHSRVHSVSSQTSPSYSPPSPLYRKCCPARARRRPEDQGSRLPRGLDWSPGGTVRRPLPFRVPVLARVPLAVLGLVSLPSAVPGLASSPLAVSGLVICSLENSPLIPRSRTC